MNEPARLVRVTSSSANALYLYLYALDAEGALWSFDRCGYKMQWTRLPPCAGVIDLYTHLTWDYDDCGGVSTISAALRVLDGTGKLWELRWCNGEYLWDLINLEAR